MLDENTKEDILEDLYLFSYRLSNKDSPRNKKMFDKLMREGGFVEFTLPIYASKEAVKIAGLNNLKELTLIKSFHQVRNRVLDKNKGKLHWEHRFEVLECRKACVEKAKILSKEDFKLWAREQIKSHWSICIISKDQQKILKDLEKTNKKIKGPVRYNHCQIEIDMIRQSLF